jgi:dTMP kinase
MGAVPRGKLIVFEGPDRAGKTTQARRLASALRRRSRPVLLVREPGGTDVGERIRDVLLDARRRVCPEAELFLYMASRAQLVRERILPALRRGRWVVCDRYLYSSVAYQGDGGGLGPAAVWSVGRLAVGPAEPDLALFLDIDPADAFRRGPRARDRIERRPLSYHRRVRRGFRAAARRLGPRAVVLNAGAPEADVASRVLDAVRRRLRP